MFSGYWAVGGVADVALTALRGDQRNYSYSKDDKFPR